jgi:ATP-dependent RNA helicase RhlE
VLVATPGRLIDHLDSGAVRLDQVETIVLDEADHMLDMGFIHADRRIVRALPHKRQSLFFSATMPKDIAALAGDMLRDPAQGRGRPRRDHRRARRTAHHLRRAGPEAALLVGLCAS